jgi:hypothetical protein
MDPRLVRQRLLAQVSRFAAFPNFFTEASQNRSCAHAQDSIHGQDIV